MRPFTLNSRLLPCLALILGCLIGSLSTAQDSPKTDPLVFKKWTPTINIPDPVAIALDPQGRAYVTQTQRRKSQDLDIRNNRDWIPTDVGLRSVDEKQAFYRSALSPEQGTSESSRRRVKDWNQDGSHDYRDLQWKSELIHVVQDSNDDGAADHL